MDDAIEILGKFVSTESYDPRENLSKYMNEKNQFTKYIQYRREQEKKENPAPIKALTPPEEFLQKRHRYFNVDSRDRDISLFPNANNFILNLSKDNFMNVSRIEIVSSRFTNDTNDDIFIMSEKIGNDFSMSNHKTNIFGKIQIAGSVGDKIYNSYVGGKKVWYDNALPVLQKIDFKIVTWTGEFANVSDYSFVLKITEIIKKVKESEYNTKIGMTLYR